MVPRKKLLCQSCTGMYQQDLCMLQYLRLVPIFFGNLEIKRVLHTLAPMLFTVATFPFRPEKNCQLFFYFFFNFHTVLDLQLG